MDEALAHIEEFKLAQKAGKGMSGKAVYGDLKQEMWRETIDHLELTTEESLRESAMTLKRQREKEVRVRKVGEWERRSAKL